MKSDNSCNVDSTKQKGSTRQTNMFSGFPGKSLRLSSRFSGLQIRSQHSLAPDMSTYSETYANILSCAQNCVSLQAPHDPCQEHEMKLFNYVTNIRKPNNLTKREAQNQWINHESQAEQNMFRLIQVDSRKTNSN